MRITEIFKDIKDDVDITNQRFMDSRREQGYFSVTPRQRARAYTSGWIAILIPQFLGFILGLAITKLLGLHGFAYVVIGGISALAVGTYKSVSFDRISLVPAIVRNIILMLLFCGAMAIGIAAN
jgi:uncharacterized membrane-anchored protein